MSIDKKKTHARSFSEIQVTKNERPYFIPIKSISSSALSARKISLTKSYHNVYAKREISKAEMMKWEDLLDNVNRSASKKSAGIDDKIGKSSD